MKKIIDIYDEYKIRGILQEHMLRVAGVASIICDNFKEEVSKENIISMCLLHDMGNIIKNQRLDFYPELVQPEGLTYWENVRSMFIKKYGTDEKNATFQIVKEIGMDEKRLEIFRNLIFFKNEEYLASNSSELKICKYSDTRVGPFGVLPLKKRFEEWKDRNPKVTTEDMMDKYNVFLKIEKEIFSKCKIKPEDITDEIVNPVMSELKNFVIE